MTQRLMSLTSAHLHLRTSSHRNHATAEKINLIGRLPLRNSSSSHGNIALISTSRATLRQQRRLGPQIFAAIKKVSAKNVACSKTLVVLPGKEADVEALCQQVVTFTKQKMADRSAGILQFDVSKEALEEGGNVYHFWELYESNGALGRHNTTPEYESFMKKVQNLLDGPIGMVLYEMKDGKLGMASVQGGPRGEGGLDDATGASGAAGGASYKQTSGVVDLTGVEEEGDDRGLWGIKFDLPWMKKKKEKK